MSFGTGTSSSGNVPLLYTYVYQRRWTDALSRCSTHPAESMFSDDERCTPLHMACYSHDPPPEIIASLALAYPAALVAKNRWGRTPLHIAVDSASPRVIRELLTKPQGKEACGMIGTHESTPLEYMCSWHKKTIDSAVSELRGSPENKQLVMLRDKTLNSVWRKACLLVQATAELKIYCGTAQVHEDEMKMEVDEASECNGDEEAEERHVVHACCRILPSCPPNLFQLAALLCPEQLSHIVDRKGDLPLHILSKNPTPWIDYSRSNAMQQDRFNALDFVTTMGPSASKVKDGDGRLPLHLAASCGMGWEGGVEVLFMANPAAVKMCDRDGGVGEGGLYPFMLSAAAPAAPVSSECGVCIMEECASSSSSSLAAKASSSSLPICSVYHLLRACPELEGFIGYDHRSHVKQSPFLVCNIDVKTMYNRPKLQPQF